MLKPWMAAAFLLMATPAFAAPWNIDPVTSKLIFSGEQAGEKFEGSFPKFTSTINFDEAAPEKGRIHIAITMASFQIDGKDRMDALPTADWFDVKQFPFAEFTSENIRAKGSDKIGINNYIATGRLSIRGVTKEIELPFALKTVAKSTVARGEVTLNRKDFGIGQGRWADDQWIKYPVKVTYEIHATAQ